MTRNQINGQPRLRLLGLVPMDFQAPAVDRGAEPMAVHRGDSEWFLENMPCVTACPMATDVPRYVAHVAEGKFAEAFEVNRRANFFPSILCLVCPRPCETACRRGLIDEPVAIRHLKRAAVEYGQERMTRVEAITSRTGYKVAIVGSGPAGMAAALALCEWGHDVAVYEEESLGGALTAAIPDFRLPANVVEEQWRALQEAGVVVHFRAGVGADVPLESLLADYHAVLLAVGCQQSAMLNVPGIDRPGVHAGLAFMKRLALNRAPSLGKRVIVIGAGLAGVDCARSARRLGADFVVVMDILPEHLLPYDPEERATAREEGIQFVFDTMVSRIVGRDRVEGVETDDLSRCDGDVSQLSRFWAADSVIVAIGQRPVPPDMEVDELRPVDTKANGDQYHPKGWPRRLFAAGDFLTGPSSVPEAMASGRRAAAAMHVYLTCQPPLAHEGEQDTTAPAWTADTARRRLWEHDDYDRISRQPIRRRFTAGTGAAQLCEAGYSREEAQREAQRCLQCQLNLILDPGDCILCGRCVEICPYRCLYMVGQESIESIDGDPVAPELQAAGSCWPDGAALVLDETLCIRCGLCVDRCPNDCLTLEPFSLTAGGNVAVHYQSGLHAEATVGALPIVTSD